MIGFIKRNTDVVVGIFLAYAFIMVLAGILACDAPVCNLDVDSNGKVEAVVDGELLTRYARGLRSEPLIEGLVASPDSTGTADLAITNHISACSVRYDVDWNGTFDMYDATTLMTYMDGWEPPLSGSPGCRRCSPADIQDAMDELKTQGDE